MRKTKHITTDYSDFSILLIIGVVSGFVLLWGLDKASLIDWDEAIFAQVSKEIVNSGDWLALHRGYEPYFNKPPLYMWTTAIFYRLFGISEYWARAGSASSGLILILVTYFLGKQIYDRRTGIFSAIILLSSYEFLRRSRFGTTDIMLTLFLFIAVYAYLRSREGSSSWWYLFWVSIALAFMVKSFAAVVVIPAVFLAVISDRRMNTTIRSKKFWLGVLVAIVIVAPWHMIMYFKFGKEFIDQYFLYTIFTRASRAIESHVGGTLFYVDVLQRLFLPWFYLTPFAIAICIKENLTNKSRSLILLFILGIIFGVYTFIVSTKIHWYIVPVYPILAILIGQMLVQAQKSYKSIAFAGLIFAFLLSVMGASIEIMIFSIFVGLMIITAWKLLLVDDQKVNQLLVLSIFAVIVIISFSLAIHMYSMGKTPAATIGETINNSTTDHRKPLFGLALPEDKGSWRAVEGPTMLFYSNRPVRVVKDMEDLVEIIGDVNEIDIVFAKRYVKNLSENYDVEIFATVNPLVYAQIKKLENPSPLMFISPD